MKILTIDTATPHLICSLGDENSYIIGVLKEASRTHSQHIISAIAELLESAGVSLDEIDYFAASEGPGSFTGLRIGIATVQALAFVKNKPCLKVNTLDAIAEDKRSADTLTLSMLDARNRRVYANAVVGDTTLVEASVGEVEIFAEKVAKALEDKEIKINKIIFAGDQAREMYIADEAVLELLPKVEEEMAEALYRPEDLHKVSLREYEAGRFLEAEELLPEYYAPTEAERELNK